MCDLQKRGDHLKGKCKTNLQAKVSLACFILITFGIFVSILGVLQKGSLWGILCVKINFAEKIKLILHVFHLKMKIVWLKLNKVKPEEGI